MKRLLTRLSLQPIMRIILMMLFGSFAITLSGYVLVIKPRVSMWHLSTVQNEKIAQDIIVARTTLQRDHISVPPVKKISNLTLWHYLHQYGVHNVSLNETEPINQDNMTLCQFSISGQAYFGSVQNLLTDFSFAGIKSFSLVKENSKSPYLKLTMEVVGFCDT